MDIKLCRILLEIRVINSLEPFITTKIIVEYIHLQVIPCMFLFFELNVTEACRDEESVFILFEHWRRQV